MVAAVICCPLRCYGNCLLALSVCVSHGYVTQDRLCLVCCQPEVNEQPRAAIDLLQTRVFVPILQTGCFQVEVDTLEILHSFCRTMILVSVFAGIRTAKTSISHSHFWL